MHPGVLRDFERTVLGAYRWLSDNYEPKDRIFLFGMLDQHVSYVSANSTKPRIFPWRIPSPRTLSHDR